MKSFPHTLKLPKRQEKYMPQPSQSPTQAINTESTPIPGTALRVSRVALGTWAMGGWMWGGNNDAESIATIQSAVDQGINLIDTAPVYGFGASGRLGRQAMQSAKLR